MLSTALRVDTTTIAIISSEAFTIDELNVIALNIQEVVAKQHSYSCLLQKLQQKLAKMKETPSVNAIYYSNTLAKIKGMTYLIG